jgi:lipopolysaccharide export system protein LptC
MALLAFLRSGLVPAPAGRAGEPRAADRGEIAFAEAARHSARVRFLRRAIPIGCAAAAGLIFIARFLNPFAAIDADVSVDNIALQGSKLTMEQPKLSGFKRDAKAYEVIADSAAQDIRTPNIVELVRPVARIEMQKGSWARLAAEKGVYDATTEKLKVETNVNVKTDSGMELRLKQADIEFKPGTLVSNDPVEVTLPNGWVKADRLNILDHGKSAVFEGNVKSEFIDAGPEQPATTGQQDKQ